MRFISLQSGSNGNSLFVEAGGVRLIFDAGISGIQAERRLASHGIDIRSVDALIISHDHTDHVSHAGIYQRKYGMPLYITKRTLAAAEQRLGLGRLHTVFHFHPGSALDLGRVRVESIPTAHDGAEGVCFVVDNGSGRLGILTDLGHVFSGLPELIESLDAVFIESNYDPGMLESGPYPAFLKKRIAGEQGHISNQDCSGLLNGHGRGLRWACLGHLSEQNNTPGLAMKAQVDAVGKRFPVHIAGRYEVTEAFCL